MAFHCGAPTRDGSPCQRHVREPGTRCPQHRNLGGTALHPPRYAMRTITLADPTLTSTPAAWITARAELMARAGELRDRVTPGADEESQDAAEGTLGDEELMTENAKPDDEADADAPAGPVGPRSYLDRERSRRAQGLEAGEVREQAEVDAEEEDAEAGAEAEQEQEHEREAGEAGREQAESEAAQQPEQRREAGQARHEQAESEAAQQPEQRREAGQARREQAESEAAQQPEQRREAGQARHEQAESESESEAAQVREQRRVTGEVDTEVEAEPEPAESARAPAMPVSQRSYLDRERAERRRRPAAEDDSDAPGPDEPEGEPEARPVEQRPLLRKERALDPDWIAARPLFRDEAPTRPLPRIEFEPSEGADAGPSRKQPRIAPMRSVVLGAQADAGSRAPANPAPKPGPASAEPLPGPDPDPDPPTLIDRMPPIDPDDLVVPEFLRPDFVAPTTVPGPKAKPAPQPQAGRPPLPIRQRKPRPAPAPAPDPPTLVDPHPAITPITAAAPDFIVPGFTEPAPEPPLRTVLSTVLGPELWQRCYVEWSPAHCAALARIARVVDGLAPSAGTTVRSTAGAGMRWLGVAREREMLADLVADAISHPAGATAPNRARTVRLYGAAICMALNVPLRRCACHRDLERDVSGELIRLGLEELAGEVP
jgi:hypothetical protein